MGCSGRQKVTSPSCEIFAQTPLTISVDLRCVISLSTKLPSTTDVNDSPVSSANCETVAGIRRSLSGYQVRGEPFWRTNTVPKERSVLPRDTFPEARLNWARRYPSRPRSAALNPPVSITAAANYLANPWNNQSYYW